MLGRDIMNQFHNKDGFTYAGTAEEADFTTLCIRCDKVDDFNPRFQNFRFRRQVVELRRRTMNRPIIISFHFFIYLINRFAEDIKNTPQHAFTDRNANRRARIFSGHTAH